jgi:hypothetical protein
MSGNSADDGGAMFFWEDCNAAVINCTFGGNRARNGNALGIDESDYPSTPSTIEVTNCILWDGGAEVWVDGSSTVTVTYSDVEGGTGQGWFGTGCIDSDPCFVDANGPDGTIGTEDDNLRLLWDSPCIDAGDNISVPNDVADLDNDGNTVEPTPWDLDGRPRFADGDCNTTDIVDMGAYEFDWVYIGDFAGGCDVNFPDFSVLGLTWQKEEGQPGYDPNCDISLPADNKIDWADLKIFCANWLCGK